VSNIHTLKTRDKIKVTVSKIDNLEDGTALIHFEGESSPSIKATGEHNFEVGEEYNMGVIVTIIMPDCPVGAETDAKISDMMTKAELHGMVGELTDANVITPVNGEEDVTVSS